MRIALLSDIHANLEALGAVLDDIAGSGVDRIICLGDVVGYNANPAECLAMLRQVGARCVAGNHDRAVAGLISTRGFNDRAARAVRWTRSRLDPDALAYLAGLPLDLVDEHGLVAVHGALTAAGGCDATYIDGEARRRACLDALRAHPSGARICAFGHTHHPGVFAGRAGSIEAVPGEEVRLDEGAYYLVNPGTVGEPRDGEGRATYMILDVPRRMLATRRLAYDREAALTKMQRAGLAPRLTAGRVINALNWRVRRLGALVGVGR